MSPKKEELKTAYRDVFLGSNAGRAVLADLLTKHQYLKFIPAGNDAQHVFLAGQRQVISGILQSCDLTPERLFLGAQPSTPVRKGQNDD